MLDHDTPEKRRAFILYLRAELDSLWEQLRAASEAAWKDDVSWAYVDGLERMKDDQQHVLMDYERYAAEMGDTL